MSFRGILDFLESPIAIGWDLAPETAIAYLRGKGLSTDFDLATASAAERASAFWVANMADKDMLGDLLASLTDAAAKGTPFDEWSAGIIPTLRARGWWGDNGITPHRLQTIFRTNMQSALAVGHWERIVAQAKDAPYLMYDAVDDHRTRPLHHAWDNTVLPVNSPWWRTHFPPNGWNSVVPDQRIGGVALLGLKAWYAGPVVEVVGKSGGRFTVTAQHPVLTMRGWVDAKALRKGDELIAYRSPVGGDSGPADFHEHDAPPTIEEAFDALGCGARASMPRATLNLNGDAVFIEGDVDVVSLDRQLLDHVQAAAAEFCRHLSLADADESLGLSPADRPDGGVLIGDRAAVSVHGEMTGVAVGAMRKPAAIDRLPENAPIAQEGGDLLSALPELCGDGASIHPRLVHLDRALWDRLAKVMARPAAQLAGRQPRSIRLGAYAHSGELDVYLGGFGVNPNAHRDILDAHAGLVEVDEVAELLFRDYAGHVYDLQTASGTMLAYGGDYMPQYVISNCRCGVIQLSAAELDDLGLTVSRPPVNGTYSWTNPRTGKTVTLPEGIDPGFDFNPGAERLAELERLAGEKAKAQPPEAAKAIAASIDATRKAIELSFDGTTAAGAWHTKSWTGAPEWLLRVAVREQAVSVTATGNGAYATGGLQINMPAKYVVTNLSHQATWRHEFGRILDVRIGSRSPTRASLLGHVSSEPTFTSAMKADARDLAARTFVATAAQAEKRRTLLEGYTRLQATLVDMPTADARLLYLRDRAGALGLDLDALRTALKAHSAALFDTLAGDIRLARVLHAIELGDAERFLAEAAGMEYGTPHGAGNIPAERAQVWATVRESWRKGLLGEFADLIGAATRNRIASVNDGFPGHTEAYYRKRAGFGQGTEVFANLATLAGAPEAVWWDLARRFMPRLVRVFEEIIRNAV